jgi:hypothetical protein
MFGERFEFAIAELERAVQADPKLPFTRTFTLVESVFT